MAGNSLIFPIIELVVVTFFLALAVVRTDHGSLDFQWYSLALNGQIAPIKPGVTWLVQAGSFAVGAIQGGGGLYWVRIGANLNRWVYDHMHSAY